ncbi:MAG: hypothetical protein Q8R81_09640 [Novosphingobium sp.]|uniref:hypothetical protein n=1 Tax=Novosphingobium sp. TaxID=1874826 RepID=UPI002733DE5B|nr:hypothetical protein [Novosphingobium sp.]MDP3550647.1 hypothetical protein [Novosphingobium sp.]
MTDVNDFHHSQRVVLQLHGERTYATVVADGSRPESIKLNVDGRWQNPQEHWRHNVVPAIAARDMVIGDLLNLQMLKDVIEQPFLGTLWTHGDSGMLTPYVCECSFGDGMRLLCISTINQRPNYHVVRVDSAWEENDDVAENIYDILAEIEEECGRARCGYSGNNLCRPREERIQWCQCEECDDEGESAWPEIDDEGGCSWGWYRWDVLMREIGA